MCKCNVNAKLRYFEYRILRITLITNNKIIQIERCEECEMKATSLLRVSGDKIVIGYSMPLAEIGSLFSILVGNKNFYNEYGGFGC